MSYIVSKYGHFFIFNKLLKYINNCCTEDCFISINGKIMILKNLLYKGFLFKIKVIN